MRHRLPSTFLGLLGILLVCRRFQLEGIVETVAELGIRRALDFGPGMFLLLATPAFAPWLLTRRDVVRSGLALGAILPAVVVTILMHRDAMASIVALGLVIGASAVLAVAVRQSSESARLRLASTSVLPRPPVAPAPRPSPRRRLARHSANRPTGRM